MKGAKTMLKWGIIALIAILVLLVIEEAVQFLFNRYMNGPRDRKGGKWTERFIGTVKKIPTSIKGSKWVTMVRRSKLGLKLEKHRKDPSH